MDMAVLQGGLNRLVQGALVLLYGDHARIG